MTDETVSDRIETAHEALSPVQVATGLAFATGIAFTLVFLQDPLAHDAMHNFRHAAGITCH